MYSFIYIYIYHRWSCQIPLIVQRRSLPPALSIFPSSPFRRQIVSSPERNRATWLSLSLSLSLSFFLFFPLSLALSLSLSVCLSPSLSLAFSLAHTHSVSLSLFVSVSFLFCISLSLSLAVSLFLSLLSLDPPYSCLEGSGVGPCNSCLGNLKIHCFLALFSWKNTLVLHPVFRACTHDLPFTYVSCDAFLRVLRTQERERKKDGDKDTRKILFSQCLSCLFFLGGAVCMCVSDFLFLFFSLSLALSPVVFHAFSLYMCICGCVLFVCVCA